MITFDGAANNGGALHAVDMFEPSELDEVVRAFEYFELSGVARLIEDTARRARALADVDLEALEDLELEANESYWSVVADDRLSRAVAVMYSNHPEAFAPLARDVAGLWEEHLAADPPVGWLDIKLDGRDPVVVVTVASTAIVQALEGIPNSEQLEKVRDDLHAVCGSLEGELHVYFDRLRRLTDDLLRMQ